MIILPNDEKWMLHALTLASQAEANGDVPIGCVITNNYGLVAEGFNQKELLNDPTAHAEIVTLRRASQSLGRWRLSDCSLFVTLEPCFMCAGAIVQSRIKRVIFATKDAKGGAGGSLANVLQDTRLNHRCDVLTGLLEEDARAHLKKFFRAKRSTSKSGSL